MFGDLFCIVCLKRSVNIHNIRLVHCSHVASLIVSGILKSKLCNALAGFLCDQLDALHNPINNLKDRKHQQGKFIPPPGNQAAEL